ncbi:MAG: hypothetical protein OEZ02_01795 [Anaerolineae bacterium]|nr:hypothetical protein [Anaerolineae bacterium]
MQNIDLKEKFHKPPSKLIYVLWVLSILILITLDKSIRNFLNQVPYILADIGCTTSMSIEQGYLSGGGSYFDITEDSYALLILDVSPAYMMGGFCKYYYLDNGAEIQVGSYKIRINEDTIIINENINIAVGESWEEKRISKIDLVFVYYDSVQIRNEGFIPGTITKYGATNFPLNVFIGIGNITTREVPNPISFGMLYLSLAISVLLSIYLGIKLTYHLGRRVISRSPSSD